MRLLATSVLAARNPKAESAWNVLTRSSLFETTSKPQALRLSPATFVAMQHRHFYFRRVKIKIYGRLADLIGRDLELELTKPATVFEILDRLAQSNPAASSALLNPRVRICLNGDLVGGNFLADPDSEIEILSVVSGG